MLQCVAVCCRVMLCVTVCCNVLKACCSSTRCRRPYILYRSALHVLQYVAVCCSLLQYVAVCCSMLQYVAVCRSIMQYLVMCCIMFSVRVFCMLQQHPAPPLMHLVVLVCCALPRPHCHYLSLSLSPYLLSHTHACTTRTQRHKVLFKVQAHIMLSSRSLSLTHTHAHTHKHTHIRTHTHTHIYNASTHTQR